ncbi:MAG: hypothetical protein M1833_000512 [Piccolia ochrophora]|nr:MAG: hypothetical protein M1833_000512 [Piccolia ochrophora]
MSMWLDRFSGQSTPTGSPPPHNRSGSPGPRRSSHLGPTIYPHRPGFSPRSSSLSLVSNASTSSLPGTTKQPDGSALKHSVLSSPPIVVSDPLDVLQTIIGVHSGRDRKASLGDGAVSQHSQGLEASPELLEEIDFDGLSLRGFVGRRESIGDADTASTRAGTAVQLVDQCRATVRLMTGSLKGCDSVLKSVEDYLESFQRDLGAVSAEIETLQNRSTALNKKLDNRRAVEKLLGPTVEDFSISPTVVRKIAEGPVDEKWVWALGELEKRRKATEAKGREQPKTKAIQDIKPLLESLTNRAIEVIRDYLVSQIKALRSPNINAQIIQRQSFLRYKETFAFLARHHPNLAKEIGQAYINTMRWYYLTHFTRYQKALEKMKLYVIDKQDAVGQEEQSKKGNLLPTAKAGAMAGDALNLGRRIDLLKTSNESALASYLAEEEKSTRYQEVPFRDFNLALVDNASAEYSFMTEFFAPNSFHEVSRRFTELFEPTFELGRAYTKSLIESTSDCLGVLLCVRLNQRFAFELQRRRIPAVDSYVNGTNMLLWPRFQVIMDMHCDSVRRTGAVNRGASSALSFATTPSSSQSAAPHAITQRFAQLLQGILALSSEAGDDEPVSSSLGRLRSDFEAFLTKLSKNMGEGKKRERFLYNNYSLVLTIIGDTNGKLAEEQKKHFEDLKHAFSESP